VACTRPHYQTMLQQDDFELKISCPGKNCANQEVSTWVHATDKKSLIINCDGHIRCTNTPSHRHPIINWKFACTNHPGEYREADFQSWSHSMALAFSVAPAMSGLWSISLIRELMIQYDHK